MFVNTALTHPGCYETFGLCTVAIFEYGNMAILKDVCSIK